MARLVVFGGSAAIGAALIARRAAVGDAVLAVDRDRPQLAGLGKAVTTAAVDATDRRSVDTFFLALGPIDHLVLVHDLVASAPPFAMLDLADLSAGLHDALIDQLGVIQAVLPTLAPAGSITLVAAHARRPSVGATAIGGALEAAVRALAAELTPRRVNRVAPATDATPPDDVAAAIGRCLDEPATTGWIVDVAAG
jgi:NAD(P)-dependent dehydrogenase (short-subunit alcohol dehydrogenase family)